MRTPVHGTPMDATVPLAKEEPEAAEHLAEAVVPGKDLRQAPHLALALAPLARSQSLFQTMDLWLRRQNEQSRQIAFGLPLMAFDPHLVEEGSALAAAISRQFASLQSRWVDGVAELGKEMSQPRKANTLSKYVDSEMNLVQQGLTLVMAQITASAMLAENIQSNLSWWVSRHAPPEQG